MIVVSRHLLFVIYLGGGRRWLEVAFLLVICAVQITAWDKYQLEAEQRGELISWTSTVRSYLFRQREEQCVGLNYEISLQTVLQTVRGS